MNKELGITPMAFGALSAAFFIPYFFCEVPSNMLLTRFGAGKWISRIMVTWGIVTSLAVFAQNFWHIYAVRFLLGAMEAGFFPGVIFYFTLWFPTKERAKVIAFFMMAMPFTYFISGPISGFILDSIHWLGLSGWRWLFFLEGLPAVIFGIVCWFYLTPKPNDAKWLTEEEKTWLIAELEKGNATKSGGGRRHVKFKEMFSDSRVWRIGIVYMTIGMAPAAMGLWTPTIIKDFANLSNTSVGLLSAIPYFLAIFAMPLWSWHSDKTGERKYHAVASYSVALLGALIAAFGTSPAIKMVGLVILWTGNYSGVGPFWTIPTLFLAESSAAIGTAVINSCNSFGGFFTSYITGYLKGAFGPNGVLLFVCAAYIIGILLLISLPLNKQEIKEKQATDSASV